MLLGEDAGFLEAEGMEKTFKFKQREIEEEVDINTSRKRFDLKLDDFGPYVQDLTRNGRHLLIGGHRGHIGALDWQRGKMHCEIQVKETVRDVKWLHNETMFAVAQRKYVYIYDQTGLELHCLKKHIDVNQLEFLPYHYLLASVGGAGYLKYQDTSTGQLVCEHRTKLGSCHVMTQNPRNAILHLGHTNGTVTLWSPNLTTPHVKMLCHRGPVSGVAVDREGRYMVTSGQDGRLKIWDVRKYGLLNEYVVPTPPRSISISQNGLLGVSFGPNVQVWKDVFKTKQDMPYMSHLQAGTKIEDIDFCPYEDILFLGHSKGLSTMIVPGSGEANFDSLEANPYQTKTQRREAEVRSLLDKIQPNMIALDPDFIGRLGRKGNGLQQREEQAAKPTELEKSDPKYKMRGRSTSYKRFVKKKNRNIIDAKRVKMEEAYKKQKEIEKRKKEEEAGMAKSGASALDRFKR